LFATRTQTVFGVGPLSPKVFFLGDAPWELDDREGEPFRGEVGDLFDKILTVMGFGREEVYLCTSIKCRPPRNRPPRNEESSNCHGYLERQLELVSPEFLCCLGITAARAILGPEMNLDTIRGRVHEYRGIPVVCTVHPAYLLKNPEAKKECWEDLKLLLRTMGRPIPSKS
jgi:DNA polymerase